MMLRSENWFLSIHSKNGEYIKVCENITNITGYLKEDIIGTSAYEYFNPKYLTDIFSSHINPNMTIVDYEFRKKDGRFVYLRTLSFKNIDDFNYIYCVTRKLKWWEKISLIINRKVAKPS